MISFEPLEKYLKNREITYQQLAGILGITRGALYSYITKEGTRVEAVERICKTLCCDIVDVIEYKEEVQEKYVVINWGKFLKMCETKEITKTALTRELKLSKNFFSTAIQRNSKLKSSLLEDICNLLNCSKEDLIS